MSALLQKKKICFLRDSIAGAVSRLGWVKFHFHIRPTPLTFPHVLMFIGKDGDWRYFISNYLFATVISARIVCVYQCINVRFPLPLKKLWVYLLNYLVATVINFFVVTQAFLQHFYYHLISSTYMSVVFLGVYIKIQRT